MPTTEPLHYCRKCGLPHMGKWFLCETCRDKNKNDKKATYTRHFVADRNKAIRRLIAAHKAEYKQYLAEERANTDINSTGGGDLPDK